MTSSACEFVAVADLAADDDFLLVSACDDCLFSLGAFWGVFLDAYVAWDFGFRRFDDCFGGLLSGLGCDMCGVV